MLPDDEAVVAAVNYVRKQYQPLAVWFPGEPGDVSPSELVEGEPGDQRATKNCVRQTLPIHTEVTASLSHARVGGHLEARP